MAERNKTGKEGESEARAYLERKGYRILHANWHFHHYELDIVAVDGEELVVVEVKTRSAGSLLRPEEAVDPQKIKRIVAAADAYVRHFDSALPVRFDIIAMQKRDGRYSVLEHIEGAFYAPGC